MDYSIFAECLPAKKRGRHLVLSAVTGVIIFFIRRTIPESPCYLLVSGQKGEDEGSSS